MTSLSNALNYARSSLATVAAQTSVASQNITNARNVDYSRRSATVLSQSSGSISISSYDRASDATMLEKLLSSTSNSAAGTAVLEGITKLGEIVGDPQSNISPSAMLGKLQNALQVQEQNPADQILATNTFDAASNIVRTLNSANATIQSVRKGADSEIANSVSTLNSLLQQFKVANNAIVRADHSTVDMADNLDIRDKIIKQLSDFIGIKTVTRANNDIAIYTESGVTLFEVNPRLVTFQPTQNMNAFATGSAVFVDGVDITSSSSLMPVQSGRIFGLAKVRDGIAVIYQSQIDEFTRGLIEAFSESSQTSPMLTKLTGLFSYAGSPTVPASATNIQGISGDIKLSAAVDPARGGSVSRIRDGSINGIAYLYNSSLAAGFSDRIAELVTAIDVKRSFDPATSLSPQSDLKSFGTSSASWLNALQQKSSSSAELHTATSQRAADALQSKTGVNIDEEMSAMLQLERSYQASAKLITTIDQMIQMLLDAVK
jgi:flagellar hook-associated protein 1